MKKVFASEAEQFSWQFKDYILQKYSVELTLKPTRENRANLPMLGVFLDENHPQFEIIRQEGRSFNPFSAEFLDASWAVGEIQKKEEKAQSCLQQDKLLNLLTRLPHGLHLGQIPGTLFIMILCSIIGIFDLFGGSQWLYQNLHYPLFNEQKAESWRFVSHAFVHLSLFHFGFNLVFWWLFGGAIERLQGTLTLMLLTLLCAVGTGMIQHYFAPNDIFFGLSGVVYGVLGFALVVDKFSSKKYDLPQGFLSMIIVGILMGLVSPFFGILIGNAAHISGLGIGALLGLFWSKR